jgi:hypothetical protein
MTVPRAERAWPLSPASTRGFRLELAVDCFLAPPRTTNRLRVTAVFPVKAFAVFGTCPSISTGCDGRGRHCIVVDNFVLERNYLSSRPIFGDGAAEIVP